MNNLLSVNLLKKKTHKWPKIFSTSYKFINLQETGVYVSQMILTVVCNLFKKGTLA